MRRGEFYELRNPARDPRRRRIFLIVSRERFITAAYSTVMAIPVYTVRSGSATEVPVGPDEGLRHDSVLRCDEITSVEKRQLSAFIGTLAETRIGEVHRAMAIALAIPPEDIEDL